MKKLQPIPDVAPGSIDIDARYGATWRTTDGREYETPITGGIWLSGPGIQRQQVVGHCDAPYRTICDRLGVQETHV